MKYKSINIYVVIRIFMDILLRTYKHYSVQVMMYLSDRSKDKNCNKSYPPPQKYEYNFVTSCIRKTIVQ